jgi:hypothetical protein
VLLSVAQSERPEEGPGKFESASEVKIHQAVNGRYLKSVA